MHLEEDFNMTALSEPQMNVWCDGSELAENEIRAEVRCLIGRIYPGGDFIDRRAERRYPYPYLVRLIPLDDDGTVLHCEAVVAVGKHLSDRGIGFYHPKPLPYRQMIVSAGGVGRHRVGLCGRFGVVPIHTPGMVREWRQVPRRAFGRARELCEATGVGRLNKA